MKDYKFGDGAGFDQSYKRCAESLKTPALAGVANSFVANMDRVLALASFPIDIVRMSMAGAFQGMRLLTGESEIQSSAEKWASTHTGDSLLADKLRNHAVISLNHILRLYPPAVPGAHGIFSGAIIGTWTAFESLAGDLWETAINAHPQELAALSGSKGKERESDEGGDSVTPKSQEDKGLSFSFLERHGYDLRNAMGTVLRERFAFTKLTEIRKAYLSAFGKRYTSVQSPLSSKDIIALSSVRNLLVHKAGVIDADFVKQASGISLFAGAKEGESLFIDGALVSLLVSGVISTSLSLLSAVDRWLETHK